MLVAICRGREAVFCPVTRLPVQAVCSTRSETSAGVFSPESTCSPPVTQWTLPESEALGGEGVRRHFAGAGGMARAAADVLRGIGAARCRRIRQLFAKGTRFLSHPRSARRGLPRPHRQRRRNDCPPA